MTNQLTDVPCPRCLALARKRRIRVETVQRLPVTPPLSTGDNTPCCFDCQAADTLLRMSHVPGFEAARIATGNDRQEQYRLPGAPMGLVLARIMRPSKRGDFQDQLRWLQRQNWFGLEEHEDE